MKQFKIDNELVIKIKKLIEDNNRDKLLSSLAVIHYADLAEIFELLETTEVIFLVKIFDKQKIADALAEIDEDLREIILEKLSAKEIAEILGIKGSSSYVRISQLKKVAIDKLIEKVPYSQVVDYLQVRD